jgi:glyoxylase I family protein
MRVSLNHVALSARDLDRSTRFYEQLFGCEQLPVPDVGFPTVWLSLGDRQLHLFARDTAVPPLHHFAVAVDDFAEACRRAEALGAFEEAPYGREAYRLPDELARGSSFARSSCAEHLASKCAWSSAVNRRNATGTMRL